MPWGVTQTVQKIIIEEHISLLLSPFGLHSQRQPPFTICGSFQKYFRCHLHVASLGDSILEDCPITAGTAINRFNKYLCAERGSVTV